MRGQHKKVDDLPGWEAQGGCVNAHNRSALSATVTDFSESVANAALGHKGHEQQQECCCQHANHVAHQRQKNGEAVGKVEVFCRRVLVGLGVVIGVLEKTQIEGKMMRLRQCGGDGKIVGPVKRGEQTSLNATLAMVAKNAATTPSDVQKPTMR